MYANSPLGGDETPSTELSAAERKALRHDLSSVAARTRELLPGDFVVGSELAESPSGPQARIAVQPPIGAAVSAGYAPDESDHRIDDEEREDLATGLAASAALQVKQAYPDDDAPPAQ